VAKVAKNKQTHEPSLIVDLSFRNDFANFRLNSLII